MYRQTTRTAWCRAAGALFLGLFLASPAFPRTLLVDFEHFPGLDGGLGTPDDVPTPVCSGPFSPAESLTTQYSPEGLTFSAGTLFCGGTTFWPGHEHFISSTQPDATLTVPVREISITSYSFWTATLTAYDAAGSVLATTVLIHPAEGTAPFLGTLTVTTSVSIARFTVRAATPSLILNLDDLVLTVKPQDFFTAAPCRLVDTRAATDPLGGPALKAGIPRTFSLVGACGIPPTARALAVNVTVVGPSTPGDVRLYPGDRMVTGTSVVNFGAGQTRAHWTAVSLGAGGTLTAISAQPTGTVDLVLDLQGYFE